MLNKQKLKTEIEKIEARLTELDHQVESEFIVALKLALVSSHTTLLALYNSLNDNYE